MVDICEGASATGDNAFHPGESILTANHSKLSTTPENQALLEMTMALDLIMMGIMYLHPMMRPVLSIFVARQKLLILERLRIQLKAGIPLQNPNRQLNNPNNQPCVVPPTHPYLPALIQQLEPSDHTHPPKDQGGDEQAQLRRLSKVLKRQWHHYRRC
jgi:hypothetical protein